MEAATVRRPSNRFLAEANATLLKLGIEAGQASWVYSTYITQDTEALNARANQLSIEAGKRFAKEAARFDGVQVTPEQRRQLESPEAVARAGDARATRRKPRR